LFPASANWDGTRFVSIASEGYFYDPDRRSTVAFFPFYPLCAAILSRIIPIGVSNALLLVANSAFVLSVLGILQIATRRDEEGNVDNAALYTVFSVVLFPTSVFFRLCYSDALMLLLAVLLTLGMQRRWNVIILALIVGLASATRPVGIGLTLPLLLHIWQNSDGWSGFATRCIVLLPLMCSGLIVYMIYLQVAFGDASAFATTQRHWWRRVPSSVSDHVIALATLEPIRAVYDSSSAAYWGRGLIGTPMFSLRFANPIYFIAMLTLVAFGAWRRWLDTKDVLLSAAFLLIPYVSHSFQTCFAAEGRYSSIVFPAYIVAGRLLSECHRIAVVLFFTYCIFMLAAYSALFAAWYDII